MIRFRNMIPQDIPEGLALCRHAGWNQLARDWQLFLSLNPTGCRVAVDENESVIGTVVTTPYQHRFTWIGMVLVHPARQRQGIGSLLLREALKITEHDQTVKLDATPAGREVYLKLGFVDEYGITRMFADKPVVNALPLSSVQFMQPQDLPGVLELDREVFGADRKPVLDWIYERARQFAFVVKEHGVVKGFCFGRPGYNFNQIGPVVARNVEDAMQLVQAAVQRSPEKPVIIDVLDRHVIWSEFIVSLGFRRQRPLVRMYRGSNANPGKPDFQFAILGPEFG